MSRRGTSKAGTLAAALRRRATLPPERRAAFDALLLSRFRRKIGVVFTDTADFTVRTARDGILHFLMVFDRGVAAARPVVARVGGEIVKVEGDSLLIRFPDVGAACRGVIALEACLRRLNRGKPAGERLAFSYGIGYGDVLDLGDDLFGLEVNLASKLGEDMARPGEALLTPSAAAALDDRLSRRLVSHGFASFLRTAVPVRRLLLSPPRRPRRRAGVKPPGGPPRRRADRGAGRSR